MNHKLSPHHRPAPSTLSRVRQRLLRPPSATPVDLHGRTVVVTGASEGSLGYETAAILAAWGAEVIVTRRSGAPELAASIAARSGGAVRGQDLDLGSAASVSAFVRWYAQQVGPRLDVLVNNAGIHLDLMADWKEPRLSADGFELQWRTNFLGPFQLTLGLLPALRAAASHTGDARVVNVASHLHTRGRNAHLFTPNAPYNSWVAYGTSKLAMLHMAFELTRRYGAEGLNGYALHPGAVFTNVASKGLDGHATLERVRGWLAPVEGFFLLTPEEGAQTSVHCATHPSLAGGRYFTACAQALASTEAEDAAVSTRLWEQTASWVAHLP
ncbi:MAG: SDR family NAD(P)-dependent oxidoreductase [Myxococcales bacterium]|nr:SDR family NAD(P)-dependent oxidoreductase [Myxococcales bacterium]MCB9628423.1 SDR family NAD(P)-dependent oxidoreductase [Sandaracinaceae bacterium]